LNGLKPPSLACPFWYWMLALLFDIVALSFDIVALTFDIVALILYSST
jgi:hypothetical protein